MHWAFLDVHMQMSDAESLVRTQETFSIYTHNRTVCIHSNNYKTLLKVIWSIEQKCLFSYILTTALFINWESPSQPFPALWAWIVFEFWCFKKLLRGTCCCWLIGQGLEESDYLQSFGIFLTWPFLIIQSKPKPWKAN